MLFDKIWAQIKGAERSGTLTVEEALDFATRLSTQLPDTLAELQAGTIDLHKGTRDQ